MQPRTERDGIPSEAMPGSARRTSDRNLYTGPVVEPALEEQAAARGTVTPETAATAPDAAELAAEPGEQVEGRLANSHSALQEELDDWRDRAMRLQADMDNYRKRQQRLAQDQIEAERQRLLGAFLQVVDDLERALAAPATTDQGLRHDEGLRRGVELTHRAAMQLLQREGVEPIEARNKRFDPNWHEAVATVGHNGSDAPEDTVIEVVESGYRLGERMLRPAKVIVAV